MLNLAGRGLAPLASLALAAAAIALCPPPAEAAVVRMAPEGDLRIDGFATLEERISVSYATTGGGASGAEPRFVITDRVGVFAIGGSSCRATGPETITCDALPVGALSVGLGAGNDTLTIDAGVPASYTVSANGGPGNDVIQTAGGADRIVGGDGRDILAGGGGPDRIAGGSGADGLIGFGGKDVLNGGAGRDALFGLEGRDFFRGGPGNDLLLARDKRRDRLVDCGRGSRDRALRDRIDPRPRNCPRRKAKRS